ncbi:hypothetical protein ACFYR1_20275 [Streptomyces canus]|uniref:hypothetical protein n=1 Tax=Streptomyces canus TaxID=58343 RepID=UPI0036998C14
MPKRRSSSCWAGAAGYQIALSAVAASRSEQEAVETLLADRCEALILLSPHAPAARPAEFAAQLPVVSVARRLRPLAEGVDVVRAADEDLVGLGSQLGHRTTLVPNRRRPGHAAAYPLGLSRVPRTEATVSRPKRSLPKYR